MIGYNLCRSSSFLTLAAEVSISEGRGRFTNFNFMGSDYLDENLTLESGAFIGQSNIRVSYRDESKHRIAGVLVSLSNFCCAAYPRFMGTEGQTESVPINFAQARSPPRG